MQDLKLNGTGDTEQRNCVCAFVVNIMNNSLKIERFNAANQANHHFSTVLKLEIVYWVVIYHILWK